MAKINLKDFDFKQFFLRYGEWVGLAPRTSFRTYPKRRPRY